MIGGRTCCTSQPMPAIDEHKAALGLAIRRLMSAFVSFSHMTLLGLPLLAAVWYVPPPQGSQTGGSMPLDVIAWEHLTSSTSLKDVALQGLPSQALW